MSRIYENGYTVEYPEKLAYAGMPMLVRVANADNYVGVGVTINVGGKYYTERRTIYNGGATFDLARYAQMAFVGKALGYNFDAKLVVSELSQLMEVVVVLTDNAGATTTATSWNTEVLWGYLGIQQTNGGGTRLRKWFANYPQTFDFYATTSSSFYLEMDNGDVVAYPKPTFSRETQQVAIEVSPKYAAPKGDVGKGKITGYATPYLDGGVLKVYNTVINLEVDRSTSGVYLRWLDHLGQWCYYLFRVTGRNYTSKETQSWQDGILRDNLTTENNVYLQSGLTMHQYSQQESISLGAKLVDAEMFSFLLSLTHSPIVEVLVNAEEYQANNAIAPRWERVSVVGGSYARSGAPLQDFLVSINRYPYTSQML